jgi:hypothetical protein
MFRQATPPFDERSYGFASLVDLLRAAQKDGLVRLERDRQGVVRVFQGSAAPAPVRPPVAVEPPPAPEEPIAAAAAAAEEPTEPDLSTGPGNSITDPPHILEVPRRRARPAAPRAAGARTKTAAPRRHRKKAE